MTTTLTDVPEFPNVTVPGGGDARTISSLIASFQQLANRTRVLLNTLNLCIDSGRNGAFGLQWVNTIAEMQALPVGGGSGVRHAQVCLVLTSGLWLFDQYAVGADIPHTLLAGAGGSGVPGRWRAIPIVRNVAGAVTALDTVGRMPAAVARYGTIFADGVSPSTYTTGTSVAQDVPGSEMNVTLAVGDLAMLWFNGTCQTVNLDAAIESDTRVAVVTPAGAVVEQPALTVRLFGAGAGAGNFLQSQLTGLYRATSAGPHTIKLRTSLSSASSSGTGGFGGGNLFTIITRP